MKSLTIFLLVLTLLSCNQRVAPFPNGSWILQGGLVYSTNISTQAQNVYDHFSRSNTSSLDIVNGPQVPLERIVKHKTRWTIQDRVLTLDDSLRYIQRNNYNGSLLYSTENAQDFGFYITQITDSTLEIQTFERQQSTGVEQIRYYSVLNFRK